MCIIFSVSLVQYVALKVVMLEVVMYTSSQSTRPNCCQYFYKWLAYKHREVLYKYVYSINKLLISNYVTVLCTYHFLSASNEEDHTFFSANFFRMTNARDYRISYQDVRLNTTNLSTAEQNITAQNITEQRPTEQDSLVMRDRFGDINGNNNWLRCKLHIITFVEHCVHLCSVAS